ncbi:efflux transporter, outer membrane factor (OMF) lipoprotein, NodT family [Enhydrobacter aerosaccus]|uniref:Efflux transporter, outer membrane factor (OMF) lipoprotein, NodT family n=1 Tax=Enhydrobacter aerosaccus TaxID=225324 RepID=A0A1T4P1G8_9HYPH|nr:efflux transporter outer membrane subunit [Enhydrobacter aerosaccus]SJZ85450.1 efflux transporter, outer membrane factor (OMF) lipoprotein, NodT family [Enhydrobacter aerosaccus]
MITSALRRLSAPAAAATKVAAVLALTGCTVGPDFVRADPPKDKTYLASGTAPETVATRDVLGGEAQRFVGDLDIPAQWWQVYKSKPLDDLIDRSMKANPDIQSAIQALKAAQETAKAQRATLFPTVGLSGSATQNQTSTALAPVPSNNNTVYGLFNGLLNVTYVLDLWGGNRRAAESLEALAESQCFLLEAAYLSLSSNVVVTAVTEASLRGQIAATERTIEIQRQSLALLQRRMAIGQSALADVATQQAALAQSEALLPPLRNQLSQQRHLLAQLTGQTTAHIPAETFQLEALTLPQELPVSLPSRMVEQRPDVRSAEANVHAAAADVGVATANMLPQITLGLSFGSTATDLATLFSPELGATFAGGATSITQTLVDGGALSAKRRAAVATWEQAKAQYRSTVLTAFRNVADSLRALENDAVTLKAAADAERAAKLSLEITQRRMAAGDAGILDILNAELTYQSAAMALVQARAARYSDTAALFQALGGGWWNRDSTGALNPAQRATCKAPTKPPKPQPWPDSAPTSSNATTDGPAKTTGERI